MTKIYELAEQAAEYAVLNPEDSVLQSETEDRKVEIPKAFIDKFAELFVKECVKILSNESERLYALSTDGGDDFDTCAEKCLDNMLAIKEHFGVEENA